MVGAYLWFATLMALAPPQPKSPYSFKGLGDLPEGLTDSRAYAVSLDGKTVVGTGNGKFGREGFVWTEKDGLRSIGKLMPIGSFSEARAVSADGSVVVGFSKSRDGQVAVRWTEKEGLVSLGRLAGAGGTEAAAVSMDGSVVVGNAVFAKRTLSYKTIGTKRVDDKMLPSGGIVVKSIPFGGRQGWVWSGGDMRPFEGGFGPFEFFIRDGSPYGDGCWAEYWVVGSETKGKTAFLGYEQLIGCRTLGDVRLTGVGGSGDRFCGTIESFARVPEPGGFGDEIYPVFVRDETQRRRDGFVMAGDKVILLATKPDNVGLVTPPSIACPTAISASGKVVVGYLGDESFAMAAVWEGGGGRPRSGTYIKDEVFTLADAIETATNNAKSYLWAVSANGEVSVGDHYGLGNQSKAFAMSRNCIVHIGIEDLFKRHCPKEIEGWRLVSARGISGDGKTVVGWGVNPAGKTEAWVATIGNVNVTKEELFGKGETGQE